MIVRRPPVSVAVLAGALAVALSGCGEGSPTVPPGPVTSALTAPVPGVTLPPDALLPLVPSPADVPGGLVPILAGSGARDLTAVAGYSGDPARARASLTANGFSRAYVAQYADPAGARVLSVVVARFRDAAGAQADLAADLAESSGDLVDVPQVGEQSQVRRQPLPGATEGQLVTLRFRQGATTWLLAYGDRPGADPEVAVRLGRLLAERAAD